VNLELDIEPRRLAAALSLLPPGHVLLAAAMVGVQVAHERAAVALDDYYDLASQWHHSHLLPEFSQLQRLRYPPSGDRAEWVRNGPPGHVDYVSGQEAAA
jgi:hypothetical protein